MGVKGLASFIEQNNASKKVNIAAVAKKEQIKLVVDAWSWIYFMLKKSKINYLFPSYFQYRDAALAWINAFKQHQIELVFFFDGTADEIKEKTTLRRYQDALDLTAGLYSNASNDENGQEASICPPLLELAAVSVLRAAGVKIQWSAREADREIAAYAHRTPCFAVLSQDSDFLIFETPGYIPLWSLELSDSGISGMLFTTAAVAHTLGIPTANLPLFASLVGNDYTLLTLRELPALHTRMGASQTSRSGEIIATVAKFLAKSDGTEAWMREKLLGGYHPKDIDRITKRILESIKQYDVTLPDEEFSAVVPASVSTRYRQGLLDSNLCGVLEKRVSWLSLVAEDPNGSALPIFALLSPIRYRIYSAVLDCVSSALPQSPISMKEYVSIAQRYRTQQVELKGVARGISQILKAELSAEAKLENLLAIVFGNEPQVAPLPSNSDLHFAAVVLRALVVATRGAEAQLHEAEFDAIVASIVHLTLSSGKAVHSLKPSTANMPAGALRRTAHIAQLIQVMMLHVHWANQICDIPLRMPSPECLFSGPEWLWCFDTARPMVDRAARLQKLSEGGSEQHSALAKELTAFATIFSGAVPAPFHVPERKQKDAGANKPTAKGKNPAVQSPSSMRNTFAALNIDGDS